MANAPITILLVGETGVGKSSVLELFANVLAGKDIDHCDFDILDHTNEQGGSDNQSQTKSARLYEFKSRNGIMVGAGVFERLILYNLSKGSCPRHTRVSRHPGSSTRRAPQEEYYYPN